MVTFLDTADVYGPYNTKEVLVGRVKQGEALHPVLALRQFVHMDSGFMHIPTLKSNAILSGLKTFYPIS
jgi:hypothetical protein